MEKPRSRVEKNRELYQELYRENYFQNNEPKELEKTNEIDIERVKELLKGREMYRREMKLREINMSRPREEEKEEVVKEESEKDYDINSYLNKASSTRETEPYHKIDPEILKQPEPEISQEPNLDDLKTLGDTTLSLGLFDALSKTSEIEKNLEEKEEKLAKTLSETATNSFFTDSIKLSLADDDEDDEEEKSSTLVKVIMALLIVVVLALVVFIIIM